MFNKEMIGKNAVFIIYLFTISLITAVLHIVFEKENDTYEFSTWSYLFLPFVIGFFALITLKWIILDVRITSFKNKNTTSNNSINWNIISMIVYTGLMSLIRIDQIIDMLIFLVTIFHVMNKLVHIQTIISSVARIPKTIREGIIHSKYFFWNVYESESDLREFIVSPVKCPELKIFSNLLEEHLVLPTKMIAYRKLGEFEQEFSKNLFDFNSSELILVDMTEI